MYFETETAPPCFSSESFNKRAGYYKPNHYTEGPTFFFGETLMGEHWFLVFCQYKVVLFFPAELFCSYINYTPLEWMELVISFCLEQLSRAHKVARLLWNVPRVHFPVMCQNKTPSHKAQNAFKDKMSAFNSKNKFPAWTHRLLEQQQCDIARNLKEELSFQKNGSNLISQFPKHLEHKLTFKCTMVPAVLTGQSVCLKHTSTWFTGLYQCLLARCV